MSENPYVSPDHGGDPQQRKKWSKLWIVIIVIGIGVLLLGLLLPAVRTARPAARRNMCINNLKQIGLALNQYESAYHALPPAYTVDADGKPLHSWRTLILPFMDENRLYESIDLSKPWDDSANAAAYEANVDAYRCPEAISPANHTGYFAITAPGGCFRPGESRQLSEITDGPRKTLMVIEVSSEKSVPWMSPNDADEQVIRGFSPTTTSAHTGGVSCVLFADGHVGTISTADLPADQLRAMISIAAGDEVRVE